MQLVHSQDQLVTAENDMKRAQEEVENIQNAIIELQSTTDQYQNDMQQNQQEYEDKVEELKQNYETASTELLQQLQAEIEERFEKYTQIYDDKKEEYIKGIQDGITNINYKLMGLKDASMNQRSIIMVLYEDFCDALYYHSFTECSVVQTPVMSDDFDKLLDKLEHLQWDLVEGLNGFDVPPTEFTKTILIEDTDKYHQPIGQVSH